MASMRCWAITFELGGREFEIPAMPAADWWPILSASQSEDILDTLESSASALVDTMLLAGEVSMGDLNEAMTAVIEEVTGRSMHVAVVLATVTNMNWAAIGGAIARRGFLWDERPIGAALDLVYATIMEGLEDKPRDKFLELLDNEALTDPSKRKVPTAKQLSEFETMAGPRPAPAPLPGQASAAPSGSARPRTRTRPRQRPQDARSAAPTPRP